MQIAYKNSLPTLEEYLEIREKVDFVKLSARVAQRGLENSSFVVSAYHENILIGIARLISDGGYVNFISDVIVHPDFQGAGVGKKLVKIILDYLKNSLEKDEKVGVYLMSAKGKEPFYEKLGFNAHPNSKKGAGMSLWLEND